MFAAPCRAALAAKNHADASARNLRVTGRGLSQQAFGIVPKIREVDDAITPECRQWAYEVHPEVCFWAMAGGRPMTHRKKIAAGVNERLALLRTVFPDIDRHLLRRPSGVGKDDLLDAAAAAWTALANCGKCGTLAPILHFIFSSTQERMAGFLSAFGSLPMNLVITLSTCSVIAFT
jgi:predicted RNase H-like nuclease